MLRGSSPHLFLGAGDPNAAPPPIIAAATVAAGAVIAQATNTPTPRAVPITTEATPVFLSPD